MFSTEEPDVYSTKHEYRYLFIYLDLLSSYFKNIVCNFSNFIDVSIIFISLLFHLKFCKIQKMASFESDMTKQTLAS